MKKNILLIVISLFITFPLFAQEKLIYMKKENLNPVQLSELQKKGAIVDEFSTYTDVSFMAKIESLTKNWTRDGMNDLLDDFKISPNQFGVVIDTLSSVIISQSNDIPNTKVGKIALVGFGWKLVGPSVFRFIVKILCIIFILWFFLWSYKKNVWTHMFVMKRKKGFLRDTPIEKKEIDIEQLFEDSWLTDGDGFEYERNASKLLHIVAGIVLFLLTLFL